VLEVLAHADLPHELVLVAVHAGELADVREDVLDAVRQLERVHVVEPVLDVRVHDQLGQPQDLAAQVERCRRRGGVSCGGIGKWPLFRLISGV
jgi:hypothetical protein